jgi:hypothetical protein
MNFKRYKVTVKVCREFTFLVKKLPRVAKKKAIKIMNRVFSNCCFCSELINDDSGIGFKIILNWSNSL